MYYSNDRRGDPTLTNPFSYNLRMDNPLRIENRLAGENILILLAVA